MFMKTTFSRGFPLDKTINKQLILFETNGVKQYKVYLAIFRDNG